MSEAEKKNVTLMDFIQLKAEFLDTRRERDKLLDIPSFFVPENVEVFREVSDRLSSLEIKLFNLLYELDEMILKQIIMKDLQLLAYKY